MNTPVLTFDVLLQRFDASAQAQAELAMTLGQRVEVVKTHIAGTTRYALVIDGKTVAVVRG